MRTTGMSRKERSFCIALLAALAMGGALYLADNLIRQNINQTAIDEVTTVISPGQMAHVSGNSDGSDGIPWSGTMNVQVIGCTLYESFTQAQATCDLGNLAHEGQDENDPYLVVELRLSNIDAQTKSHLVDENQNSVDKNGVNASIFMLQGDDGTYLPLSVMTDQPSFAVWTFLLDTGQTTTLRLGYSLPISEKLSDPYVYVATPLWRLRLEIPPREGA